MPELVRTDGCRIRYEVSGPPGTAPILLLEGMGGDLPGWTRTIPNLDRDHLVVAFDHRGNGWSGAPDEPQTMQTFVDDALALADHLELGRLHLYGQSFGGMVALELALAHPERLRTLIVACAHAGGDSVISVREPVPKGQAGLVIFSAAYADEHPEGVAALFRSGVPQQPHAGRRQWEAMQGYDVADRLGEISVPTLILQGTDDRVIAPDNARFLADRIPGAELVLLAGAGHVYHWEQPDTADGAVLDFIGKHP